ncbi:MAG: transposase [Acidobacteriaceae bacterium]|nr:transposase [Acidobacteriaceae bacterium]
MPRRKHVKRGSRISPMVRLLEPNAAGIDIGATEVYVAVPSDRDTQPVRCFSTFTDDLNGLVDWLHTCGVDSVAMESTSVFWIPLFQILEDRGFRVCLVNARHVKNVPGRKTDVSDCQCGYSICTRSAFCVLRIVRHKPSAPSARSVGIGRAWCK